MVRLCALEEAARRGDSKRVGQLLTELRREDLLSFHSDKKTVLHWAVEHGHLEAVEVLVGRDGTNLAAKDWEGSTALHLAAKLGHDKIVTRLLEKNPNLALKKNLDGLTCLHFAVISGHVTVVKQLLATNLPLINVLSCERSALYCAVKYGGHQEIVELLVESVQSTNGDGYAKKMFHDAAWCGCDRVMSQLLAQRPHLIDTVDNEGRNVLQLAALRGRYTTVRQLLDQKPSLADGTDKIGRTALHAAAEWGEEKVVTLLLARRPGLINVKNAHGQTALSLAVDRGHHCVGSSLFTHGATGVDEGMFWRVLNQAKDGDSDESVKLMLERQPELIRSIFGDDTVLTVLHRVFGLHVFTTTLFSEELILKCWQMNPEALHQRNKDSDTPFHVAIRSDNKFAIELVQSQLSLDEIVSAFATCNKECPQSILDQLGECLWHALNKDVVKIVCDYSAGLVNAHDARNCDEEIVTFLFGDEGWSLFPETG